MESFCFCFYCKAIRGKKNFYNSDIFLFKCLNVYCFGIHSYYINVEGFYQLEKL